MDSTRGKGSHGYDVDVGLSGMTDRWDVSTQRVDLRGVFSTDVGSSGSFDLRDVGSTSLRKLLDALPVPALMIDLSYSVVFTNTSCDGISPNFKTVMGLPFASLIPRARNAEKAQLLIDKVFRTRKPQVAEGILEVDKKKLWGRIHFRPVRTGADRYILIIIEDLTAEKIRLLVDRRRGEKLKQAHDQNLTRVHSLSDQLSETNRKLSEESARNRQAQDALTTAHRKFRIVADKASMGIALAGKNGTFYYVNSQFGELFGYDLTNVPEVSSWFGSSVPPSEQGDQDSEDFLRTLVEAAGTDSSPVRLDLTCLNGKQRSVSSTIEPLEDGNYVLTFEEVLNDPECG
jgi:PAS domain S-box-containing protein